MAGRELGMCVDPQFGPVLLFGSGGQLVEVYRDRALGLPPLNSTLARRLMEQTKVCKALQGVRGRKPVDETALERVLVRFSELVVDQPRIREIDINPLLASPEGLLALDARIVLFGGEVADKDLPRAAIRPYPIEYVSRWAMRDGGSATIRPICAEGEPRMVEFHRSLSDASVYLRFFQTQKLESRVAHERLIRRCFLDYDREMALIAERSNEHTGAPELLGVARLVRQGDGREAELGLLVADRWQKAGVGTELLRRLIEVAEHDGIERIHAEILAENAAMLALARRFHFELAQGKDYQAFAASLRMGSPVPAA